MGLTDGPNEKIQCVVDAGVIPSLVTLLDSGEISVMTPSLRTLGNIVTGNDTQTDAVLAAQAVPVFAKLLQHPKMNIVKEAAWTITNLTSGGTVSQIVHLCGEGVLKPFCDLLAAKDDKTVGVVLDGVSNILATAEKLAEVDKVAMMVEECGGLDKIEQL